MSPPNPLLVSVVVPYRDARRSLPALLEALGAQTLAKSAFEVLLVDDGSRDGGVAALPLPPGLVVIALSSTTRGAYAARNEGLRVARGAALAFTDADCVPRPDWLVRGLAALERAPRVAGHIDVKVSGERRFAERLDAARFLRQEHYARRESFGATANLFWRRSVAFDVGPFEARLCSGADEEHGRRAHERGVGIVYAADVIVEHPARASLRSLARKATRVGYGVGQKMRLHGVESAQLLARARDRLALAPRAVVERERPLAERLALAGGHALLALCTAAGFARGALAPPSRLAEEEEGDADP